MAVPVNRCIVKGSASLVPSSPLLSALQLLFLPYGKFKLEMHEGSKSHLLHGIHHRAPPELNVVEARLGERP